MFDNSNVDENAPQGAGENQSSVSKGNEGSIADAPTSQELLKIRKELELLRAEQRGLQGRQDKSQNEVQRFMDEIKSHMAQGKTFEQAENAVIAERKASEKDDLLFKIAEKVGVLDKSSQAGPVGSGPNVTDDVARKIVDALNMDLSDAKVAELYAKKDLAGLAQLSASRQAPSPSAADAPPLDGAPPRKPDGQQLAVEYKQKMQAARGNKTLLNSIKAEYKSKGVDVYNVDFS